jgi:hypothetical protein
MVLKFLKVTGAPKHFSMKRSQFGVSRSTIEIEVEVVLNHVNQFTFTGRVSKKMKALFSLAANVGVPWAMP